MKHLRTLVILLPAVFLTLTAAQMQQMQKDQKPREEMTQKEKLETPLLQPQANFMNDKQSRDKFLTCPSTLPAVHLPKLRTFFVALPNVAASLIEADVREPITLELYSGKGQRIAPLGTHKPTIDTGGGEDDLTWSLPEYVTVKLPRDMIRKMVLERLTTDIPLFLEAGGALVYKNAAGKPKAIVAAPIYFPFTYRRDGYGKLDYLIAKQMHPEALTYCSAQKGELRGECFDILADARYRNHVLKLIQAKDFDALDKYCAGREETLRLSCYRLAGIHCLLHNKPDAAIRYFQAAGDKVSSSRIGEIHFIRGELEKALPFFEKGIPSARRARFYGKLADRYKDRDKPAEAKTYYLKAVNEYEFMIKDFDYDWSNADNNDRLRCMAAAESYNKTAEEIAQQDKVNTILAKTGAYCDRLSKEMIHFFCKEYIEETARYAVRGFKNTFVYEYQLIKEKDEVVERRILLKRNGRRKREENAPLGTSKYRYEKLIYGPIVFMSKKWHKHYDYKIIGEETIKKEKTVVIEAVPKSNQLGLLVGKIWVGTEDYGVLRVEWHPKYSIENIEGAVELADKMNSTLDVSFVTNFGVKKNGIRFPSKYAIQEYFVEPNGKRKLKAMIKVDFKKYMFFSVGTQAEVNPDY